MPGGHAREARSPRLPEEVACRRVGSVESDAAFGAELIREPATLQAFFAPGGGLEFWMAGGRPATLKLILATGRFARPAPSFGPTLTTALGPIETVPGAPDASITAISLRLGATYKKNGGEAVSYVDFPRNCPRGGYRVESDLIFQDGERANVTARAPCRNR